MLDSRINDDFPVLPDILLLRIQSKLHLCVMPFLIAITEPHRKETAENDGMLLLVCFHSGAMLS